MADMKTILRVVLAFAVVAAVPWIYITCGKHVESRVVRPNAGTDTARSRLQFDLDLMVVQLKGAYARVSLVEEHGHAPDDAYSEARRMVEDLPPKIEVYRRRLAEMDADDTAAGR